LDRRDVLLDFRRAALARFRIDAPTAQNPPSIIAQVDGSGTAGGLTGGVGGFTTSIIGPGPSG
jgi:hypothetical protein